MGHKEQGIVMDASAYSFQGRQVNPHKKEEQYWLHRENKTRPK